MDEVPQEWRDKVAGTLINPDTLLATDYLNHFNEVVMLIGMLGDIPDMLPDCEAWQPKTYPEHFRTIGLDYGPLAAEAYEHVPASLKDPFELTVEQLKVTIPFTVARCKKCADAGDMEGLQRAASAGSAVIHKLIEVLGGMIAGSRSVMDQSEIDNLLKGV
jgi:hypothetical protein